MHTKQNIPFLQLFPHKHPLGVDRFQGKGQDAGQGLPCRNWAGVLPTQKFLKSNLVIPENFIQFCPSIQRLFMIFFNTDRRMDGESHKLTHHPKQVQAEILYTPFFLPLTKRSELVKQAHSVLFG